MRTTTHRLIAATAAGALSLLLVGCGGDEDKESTKASESSASSSTSPSDTPKPDTTESETPASEAPATEAPTEGSPIDQVVESGQEQLDATKKSMEAMYSDIEILADGDSTLVYRYTYAKAAAAQASKEALEKQSEAFGSTAKALIPSLEAAGVKSPKVRYSFLDPQGKLIWENTYSK